jgi:ferric-dicitrate binding protein FerR (iron transport regulator)
MENQSEHIAYLWRQYIAGKASAAELDELFRHNHLMPAGDETQSAVVEQILLEYPADKALDTGVQERMLYQLLNKSNQQQAIDTPRIPFLRRWGWAAAASVILLLGISAYFLVYQKHKVPAVLAKKNVDIPPGKEGAVLTLADGSQVLLDSLGNGLIAMQNGAQALIKNGALVYDVTGKATGEVLYNTMSTPKGRQFSLLLPDGTKVWLNAASSIRYPTVFAGKERKVEVTGEAYFEVEKNTALPFKVNIDNRAEIEVLGTSFNVNAYQEETRIRTTLLDGLVRVSKAGRAALVQPGQQAQITNDITIVNNADIEKVMAWKKGAFNFEGLSLQEAMRQLERWYDIEVVYEGEVPDIRFWGKTSRTIPLEGLLKALSGAQLKFRIQQGRKLVIMK